MAGIPMQAMPGKAPANWSSEGFNVAYVLSRVIFFGGLAALGYVVFGDVLDDERMKWAMALPAAYLFGVIMLGGE